MGGEASTRGWWWEVLQWGVKRLRGRGDQKKWGEKVHKKKERSAGRENKQADGGLGDGWF